MAAPTTIHDLPDDMLHEIFGHVFAAEPEEPFLHDLFAHEPPDGAHLALRCVCRRWRDISDWVRLSTSHIIVITSELAGAGAIQARHPAAFKKLSVASWTGGHSTSVSRAAASLINGSADLRRALSYLTVKSCCLPSLAPVVTPIASCTALTKLFLSWSGHKKERVVPSNMLAPLSTLRTLDTLVYSPVLDGLPDSALLAPLPALPNAPRLTRLDVATKGNFVPVGSGAALGRLRRLNLMHQAPVQKLVDAEDPFLLGAAFDAGTWQPSRLTGLQELHFILEPVRGDLRAPVRPSRTGSRSGSEWAPLAGQVTALTVRVDSDGYSRPSTGIVAGLGVLTALRSLRVEAMINSISRRLEPVSIDRVYAPHLTHLIVDCTRTPVKAARFPNLVHLQLASVTPQPPLNLRSLAAQSSLKTLQLANLVSQSTCLINLAELFVGGDGWPVLEHLALLNMLLEWDTTGLAGVPTAAEFAERTRQLLPTLVHVTIREPHGRHALPDRSRIGFVMACRRHVVPALLGLRAGGG